MWILFLFVLSCLARLCPIIATASTWTSSTTLSVTAPSSASRTTSTTGATLTARESFARASHPISRKYVCATRRSPISMRCSTFVNTWPDALIRCLFCIVTIYTSLWTIVSEIVIEFIWFARFESMKPARVLISWQWRRWLRPIGKSTSLWLVKLSFESWIYIF